MQRIDLAFIGQELDDDDRGGECQRHRHIKARDGVKAERKADQEAENRGEGDLAKAGGQRDRTQCLYEL